MMFLKSEEIDEYHTCFQQPRDTNEAVLSAKPSVIQGTKISQDEILKLGMGLDTSLFNRKKIALITRGQQKWLAKEVNSFNSH